MSHAPTDMRAAGATGTRAPKGGLVARLAPYASAVLGVFTIALIWFGAYHNISRDFSQDERTALQNTENLARSFEEQIIRSVRAADQTLLYVRDAYAHSNGTLDLPSWARESQLLIDFAFQIAIIDRNGMLVASSVGRAEQIDLSDREHFKVHATRGTDELFISKPILGRVSKKWSIQLTRRISAKDGSFDGIVVVSLDPSYLSDFYDSIDIGKQGVIALVGTDAVVRARELRGDEGIGVSVAGGSLMQHFARAPAGSYVGVSPLDRIERIYNYRQVKGYPLIVVVGLAIEEAFAASRESRRDDILAAALLTLLLVCIQIVIMRYQRGLAAARDAAEAAMRARSEFLAVMSHEIRTPLNAVLGFASSLLESKLDTEQRLNAVALHGAGDDLLRLLNDILDLSRLDAGRIPFEDIPFSPAGVVDTTVSIARRSAEAKGLSLRVEIDPEAPSALRGDAGRLRQVLLNLLTNAIKFTNRGEVVVALRWLRGTAKTATVRWSVTDTGIGIAPDRIGRIFTDFAQADSSVSRRFGGSGLGLAISKRIIDQMGGRIDVSSELGRGSTFTFSVTLPIGEFVVEADGSLDSAVADLKAQIAALGRPLRVLLAEDNPTNQLVGKQLLREFDANISVASNGSEAVQQACDFAYDVVLMDMQMPEMSGIEATRAIRMRTGPQANVPIVALTANAYPEDVRACLEAGMNGFVAKPVRKSALAEEILRALAGTPAAPTLTAPAALAADTMIVDRSAVDEFIMQVGCESTDEILAVFLSETERRLGVLRSLSLDERGTIRQEAHTLKGSSGTFGLQHLSALALGLERQAATIAPDSYFAVLDELERVFAVSRRELNDYLDQARQNCTEVAE